MKSDLSRWRPVVFLPHGRQAGYTLFEFSVAAAIFAILAAVLLERMTFYQDEAERAATQKMVADLQSVLTMRAATLRAQNRADEIADLAGQNPMEWAVHKPFHYRGQFYSPAAQDIEPGTWYFDRTTRKLVYVFREGKSFLSGATKRVYFKVESPGLPTNTAKPSRTPVSTQSVVLIQVDG